MGTMYRKSRAFWFGLGAFAWVGGLAQAAAPDFDTAVRPILERHCFDCHGGGARKGGLALDAERDALQGGDSLHPALIAGQSAASQIVQRVLSSDPAKRMPPKGDPLSTEEVATLRAWIDAGAKWGAGSTGNAAAPAKPAGADHWAYLPPVQAAPPVVDNAAWVHNPIDAFALAAMQHAGLSPTREADRHTLVRRLYLDLLGLPPSPEEVTAFVQDTRPDAYERLVDTLLASPHHGERMAVPWLDIAHYADTNGFEKDRPRTMWPYRDWVINAFNSNMPFDQFVIEQIAGDMLPGATQDQRIATGFLRNTMINEEGGVDQEEYRFEAINDRMNTVGMAFLGLTLNCAQCHTHKYDALTQREYYALFAFLNNADEIEMPVVSPEITREREVIATEIAAMEAGLAAKFPLDPAVRQTFPLMPQAAHAASGGALAIDGEGVVRAQGDAAERDTYTVTLEAAPGTYHALRLETLGDAKLPRLGPGRSEGGNFVLTGVGARVLAGTPRDLTFARAEADVEQPGFGVLGAIDAATETGWAVGAPVGKAEEQRSAIFWLAEPLILTASTPLIVNLDQQFGQRHLIGKFRLSLIAENLPEDVPAAREAYLSQRLAAWRDDVASRAVPWAPLKAVDARSKNEVTFERQPDLSLLVKGDNPNTDTYEVSFRSDLQGITALRLEVLPDPSLPGGGPGRGIIMSPNEGDFLLSEIAATVAPWNAPGEAIAVPLQDASQDFAAPGREAALALDGKLDTGWSVMGGEGQPHAAVFNFATPVGHAGGTLLSLKLDQYYVHLHTLGRFRVSVTTAPAPVRASGVPAEVEAALLAPPGAERDAILRDHFLRHAPELAAEHQKIAERRKAMPKYPRALVLQERADPRVTRIHHRGEFLAEREPVQPGIPAVLPPLPTEAPPNRLSFAQWLVSPQNPLTARTTMNRLWQQFFGRGLVNTPEDFGVRGDRPTHPELLDWLAVEFMRRGWDHREMTRLIVTSSVYRQAAEATPALLEQDPVNEWLARGPRFRVDGEFVRDIALATSGLLSPRLGGPSVFPPLPSGMLDLVYGGTVWKLSEGDDRYRRGLYTFWKRTMPYPTSMTYDCPARDTAVVKRVRSNTPLQALTQLNDGVFVEAARALAQRVLREAGTDPGTRLDRAMLLCVARPADAVEREKLLAFVAAQQTRLRTGELDAAALCGKDLPADPDLAAWITLCRVLLNLDETLTRS